MLKSEIDYTPKITVVIPSLNKAKYIRQTLNSIFSQKYPRLEVIVQDGGSTDGSLEIIKFYGKKHPKNLKWVSKKDDGQVYAINEGLRKSTGDILTYINADDYYEADAFKKIVATYLKNNQFLWMVGFASIVDASGKKSSQYVSLYKRLLTQVNKYFFLLVVNYLMQPAVYFSKEAYNNFGPLIGTNKFVMEYDFWLKLGKKKMPVVIPSNLANFRMSPNNITSVLYKDLLKNDLNVVSRYTQNPLVIILHKLHNLARIILIRKL